MHIEELKNQIKDKINQIDQFDLSKLYATGPNVSLWMDMKNSETKKFVSEIMHSLDSLKINLNFLDFVGIDNVRGIDSGLTNFINEFANVQNLTKDQITTHHHGPLNQLNGLNNTLRNSALYIDLKLEPKLKEKLELLKKINPLSKKLSDNTANIEQAIGSVSKWLELNRKKDETIIKGQADAFEKRAKEHKIGGEKVHRVIFGKKIYTGKAINYWLMSTLFFSIIVGLITAWFVKEAGDDLSTGKAILKIATILVPAYLTVFSANQYLYHKKMHEAYMFKFASLNTMNNLMSHKDEGMQVKILSKGLDVLFSEPTIKEDSGKHDKQLVSELLSMLKNQIGKG